MSSTKSLADSEREIESLLQRGNLPLAEMYARHDLNQFGPSPVLLSAMALITANVGLRDLAVDYCGQALAVHPEFPPAKEILAALAKLPPLPPAAENRFLLIKAWGAGFWSEIDHLLGQLLLAEITGRTPVVHWGENFLFRVPAQSSAFEIYFKPINSLTLADMARIPAPFFPPKWTAENLAAENIHKMQGPYSRFAALYFLARHESLAVADFFTRIISLLPWIPASHAMHGQTINQVYRYLVKKYLAPQPAIVEQVDRFYREHLSQGTWLAVHARGSDKAKEDPQHSQNIMKYDQAIAAELAQRPDTRIFLITDDANLLAQFSAKFGDRIFTTNVARTSTAQGVHFQKLKSPDELGREVLIDALLAARCPRFIGNGSSNLSAMVCHLKDWAPSHCTLVSPSLFLTPNWILHRW